MSLFAADDKSLGFNLASFSSTEPGGEKLAALLIIYTQHILRCSLPLSIRSHVVRPVWSISPKQFPSTLGAVVIHTKQHLQFYSLGEMISGSWILKPRCYLKDARGNLCESHMNILQGTRQEPGCGDISLSPASLRTIYQGKTTFPN